VLPVSLFVVFLLCLSSDKQNKNTTQRDTGSTRHPRYRRKTNKTKIHNREILVTIDTQDTGGKQTKQKYNISILGQ
jgi:hypothetical protein